MDDEDALQLVKETLAQVEAALANLRQGLLEARDMPNDLARSGYALTAACNFVDAFEDFRRERLSEPLHMLNAAVFDLSEGARPALLVPVKTYNRPRDLQAGQAAVCSGRHGGVHAGTPREKGGGETRRPVL